jgi:hypothetical protein
MKEEELIESVKAATGWSNVTRVNVVTDTSDWTRIMRGDVLRLQGRSFLIKGNMYETRFGISDQPKFWVFRAIDLDNGTDKVIKMPFQEEFDVRITGIKIHCFRSSIKEARVIELVCGDSRFMQGYTVVDEHDNPIRIIDFIRGESLFAAIHNNPKSHEQFYYEDLPGILEKLLDSIFAISLLHDNHTCHGDIRNDHIIIDADTGRYRWIDFDLNQHVLDFDLWSLGNIINNTVAKGFVSFSAALKGDVFPDSVKQSLAPEDASAFYEYRIMNLKKLYPYISERLNNIMLHFTVKPIAFYTNVKHLVKDYREMLAKDFGIG